MSPHVVQNIALAARVRFLLKAVKPVQFFGGGMLTNQARTKGQSLDQPRHLFEWLECRIGVILWHMARVKQVRVAVRDPNIRHGNPGQKAVLK